MTWKLKIEDDNPHLTIKIETAIWNTIEWVLFQGYGQSLEGGLDAQVKVFAFALNKKEILIHQKPSISYQLLCLIKHSCFWG